VNRLRIISLFSLFILISSGCTRLEDLRRVELKGTKFDQELARRYQQFAEAEAREYDWVDSQHFVNKAMNAAYARRPAPESLNDWKLPNLIRPELQHARNILIEILQNQYLVEEQPAQAASAQFHFDCWVEQQEENWQSADIEHCKSEFYIAVKALAEAMWDKQPLPIKKLEQHAISAPKKSHSVAHKAKNSSTKHDKQYNAYQLIFPKGDINLTKVAYSTLSKVVRNISTKPGTQVVITSYSNQKISEEQRMDLAKARAIAVKDNLIRLGVNPNNISVFAYAEASELSASSEQGKNHIELLLND
jgi:OOP family OmpA-OmpF porin